MIIDAKFIVIVEDNEFLRMTMARVLESQGYLVLTAGGLREAIDLLVIQPVLLILDLNLPDGSGWDIVTWLAREGRTVPTVVISAARPQQQRLERARPAEFLAKPFAAGALLEVVRRLVPAPPGPSGA